VLVAEIETAKGSPRRAVAVLEEAEAVHPTDVGLLRALAEARLRNGDLPGALDAVATLKRLSEGPSSLASALGLEASLKLRAGRVQEALSALRQAHVVAPNDIAILRRTADIAEAHGEKARAVDALKKLEDLDPGNPTWRERVEKIQLSLEPNGPAGSTH
jgi:Flp pilus assembly protein TadD